MTCKQLQNQLETELFAELGAKSAGCLANSDRDSSASDNPTEVNDIIHDIIGEVSFDDIGAGEESIQTIGIDDIHGADVDIWVADGTDELSFALRHLLPTLPDAIVPKWDNEKGVMFLVVPSDDKLLDGKVIDFLGGAHVLRGLCGSVEDELYAQNGCPRAIVFASPMLHDRRILVSAIRSDLIQADQREPSVDAAMKIFNMTGGRRALFVSPQASQYGVLRQGAWWDAFAKGGRFHIVLCNLDRIRDTGRDASSPVRGAIKMFREHASIFYPGAWRWECALTNREKCERKIFKKLLEQNDEGMLGCLRSWQLPRLIEPLQGAETHCPKSPSPTLKARTLGLYLASVEKAVGKRKINETESVDAKVQEGLTVGLYELAVAGVRSQKSAGSSMCRYLVFILARGTANNIVEAVCSEINNAITATGQGRDVYEVLASAPGAVQLLSECVCKFADRVSSLIAACNNVLNCDCADGPSLTSGTAERSVEVVESILAKLRSPALIWAMRNDASLCEDVIRLQKEIRDGDCVDSAGELCALLRKVEKRKMALSKKSLSRISAIELLGVPSRLVDYFRTVSKVAPELVLQIETALS